MNIIQYISNLTIISILNISTNSYIFYLHKMEVFQFSPALLVHQFAYKLVTHRFQLVFQDVNSLVNNLLECINFTAFQSNLTPAENVHPNTWNIAMLVNWFDPGYILLSSIPIFFFTGIKDNKRIMATTLWKIKKHLDDKVILTWLFGVANSKILCSALYGKSTTAIADVVPHVVPTCSLKIAPMTGKSPWLCIWERAILGCFGCDNKAKIKYHLKYRYHISYTKIRFQ